MNPFSKPRFAKLTLTGLATGAALVALATFGSCSKTKSELPLAEVKRMDLINRVTVGGVIIPRRKSIITPPYSGYIRKIFVKVGDEVNENQPIVILNQSLRGGDEAFPLRSPIKGRVVQVLRTEGEYVEQSSAGSNPLVRIDDLSGLQVEANSPEIDFPKLRVGQPVVIKAAALGQKSYEGKIISIALAAKDQKDWERSRVEFPLLIEVLNPDEALKPGMTTVVDIIAQKVERVLAIPNEYVHEEGDRRFVVTESGATQDVQIGMQNEEFAEVKTGVSEGEKVRQVDFLNLGNAATGPGGGGGGGRGSRGKR